MRKNPLDIQARVFNIMYPFLFGFELNGHCVFYGTQMTQIMQMTADLFLLRNAFLNADDADNAEEGREMGCADTLQRKNLRRLRSKKNLRSFAKSALSACHLFSSCLSQNEHTILNILYSTSAILTENPKHLLLKCLGFLFDLYRIN